MSKHRKSSRLAEKEEEKNQIEFAEAIEFDNYSFHLRHGCQWVKIDGTDKIQEKNLLGLLKKEGEVQGGIFMNKQFDNLAVPEESKDNQTKRTSKVSVSKKSTSTCVSKESSKMIYNGESSSPSATELANSEKKRKQSTPPNRPAKKAKIVPTKSSKSNSQIEQSSRNGSTKGHMQLDPQSCAPPPLHDPGTPHQHYSFAPQPQPMVYTHSMAYSPQVHRPFPADPYLRYPHARRGYGSPVVMVSPSRRISEPRHHSRSRFLVEGGEYMPYHEETEYYD